MSTRSRYPNFRPRPGTLLARFTAYGYGLPLFSVAVSETPSP